MDLLARVRRFIRQHDLLRPEARVVCALSGGSDSVALARILDALHRSGELRFVGLAHLNHQLRPTADRDEQVSREIAARLALPIVVAREDVAARAASERCSIEVAAHDARCALFAHARAHFGADAVALGHTRDDQAETFLLRLLRGAGPRGLAAMYPRRGHLVRPLLDCPRGELREFARPWGFVDDETNTDRGIPRNRVRHDLIPLLADRFNPTIVDVLAREADVAREIWSWLEAELAVRQLDGAADGALDVDGLAGAPLALRRLALWRAMSARAGERPIGAAHVDAALALLSAADGSAVDAPGIRVHRIGRRIVLRERDGDQRSNLWSYPLSIPGEIVADHLTLSAELAADAAAGLERSANLGSGAVAAVRADLLLGSDRRLLVRNRRPGDRFRPVGLAGRKKLQDVFVDRKIARTERDSVPIVVDDRDRIVWVAGHGIDAAFRVTDVSQGVVVLRLKYLERCS
ncbi:MAG TPA: tRNA lysidine(34) synthetase TilS [Vicinamibacterales bacterium]|nr:tRNA lysidine(34) synthetase TilS [Vicinamibacterales bacterium]